MNYVSADLVNYIDTKMPAHVIKIAVVGPLAVRIQFDWINLEFIRFYRVERVHSSISRLKHVKPLPKTIFRQFLFGKYQNQILNTSFDLSKNHRTRSTINNSRSIRTFECTNL